MGRGTRWLRVRAVASSWFAVIVVAFLVLAAVGGWAAYTAHVAPGTTDQQTERVHWTVTGEFQHSADVTRENPVFDVGETLTNRTTYFSTASPVLDARFVAEYAGAAADPASLDLDAELVVRSVDEDTEYWSERTPLDGAAVSSVESGESADVAFSLNASRVAERSTEIENELGETPGETETVVVVSTDVEGTADDEPASLSFTHRLPVSVDGDTYTVGPTDAVREPMTTTETVTVPREYGPLRSVGGPLLFLVGAAGLAALGAASRRDALALTDAERDLLAFRDDRAEFDEWIVSVRLPDAVLDRPRAQADSLADLVDYAIDADSGVVEDPDTGTFYAVGDHLVVAYEPPKLDAGDDASLGATGLSAFRGFDVNDIVSGRAGRERDAAQVDDASGDSADESSEERADSGAQEADSNPGTAER